jgi:hypothetical protein
MVCCPPLLQVFTDNPLTDFVELPDEFRDLKYTALLCGVLRGALEMVGEADWVEHGMEIKHAV